MNSITTTIRNSYTGILALVLAVAALGAGIYSQADATAEAVTCPSPVAGDLNGDCAVSGQDLYILLRHLGQTTAAAVSGTGCQVAVPADIDGDCAISGQDLFKLLAHFGATSAS